MSKWWIERGLDATFMAALMVVAGLGCSSSNNTADADATGAGGHQDGAAGSGGGDGALNDAISDTTQNMGGSSGATDAADSAPPMDVASQDTGTIICTPPYFCPDAGTVDKCANGGACSMLELAYVTEIVLQGTCTLGAAGECAHQVLADLEYPCPNNEAWVDDTAQIDNLVTQWNSINCNSCYPGNCTGHTYPPLTTGQCVAVTTTTPAGPQTRNECQNKN
jgi:hypothetical protein